MRSSKHVLRNSISNTSLVLYLLLPIPSQTTATDFGRIHLDTRNLHAPLSKLHALRWPLLHTSLPWLLDLHGRSGGLLVHRSASIIPYAKFSTKRAQNSVMKGRSLSFSAWDLDDQLHSLSTCGPLLRIAFTISYSALCSTVKGLQRSSRISYFGAKIT